MPEHHLEAQSVLERDQAAREGLGLAPKFRQISLGATDSGALTDPRSLLGTLTFDGSGRFSFTVR